MKFLKRISFVIVFIISLYGLPGCGTPSYMTSGVHYTNPSWAPPYYTGVRYYYFPDIEAYYDLTDQQFVYLDNGQWFFSPVLPPLYAGYDLYTGYVISLNVNVYRPWLHHQYYISHYPRYYYRSIYRNTDVVNIRGVSENEKKPVYWKQEDRNRINDLRKNDKPMNKPDMYKQPQPPVYNGKKIGQTVKVKPEMREKKPTRKKGDNKTKYYQFN